MCLRSHVIWKVTPIGGSVQQQYRQTVNPTDKGKACIIYRKSQNGMGKRNLAIDIGAQPIIFYSERVSGKERSLLSSAQDHALQSGRRICIAFGEGHSGKREGNLLYSLQTYSIYEEKSPFRIRSGHQGNKHETVKTIETYKQPSRFCA